MALATVLIAPGTAAAHPTGRRVLPPDARPEGYSLTKMTRQLALFTTSGNDPAYYPDTPFQVLYFEPSTVQMDAGGGGWSYSGTNTFTVRTGTQFFVPLQNADDSPPVLGRFPVRRAAAQRYLFDRAQLGARGYEIVVDGVSTRTGRRYLAGPVATPPLLDGGGTHMITLGTFLGPLAPGRHTVTIRGGLYGDLLPPTYGIRFLASDFTYRVNARPPRRG